MLEIQVSLNALILFICNVHFAKILWFSKVLLCEKWLRDCDSFDQRFATYSVWSPTETNIVPEKSNRDTVT